MPRNGDYNYAVMQENDITRATSDPAFDREAWDALVGLSSSQFFPPELDDEAGPNPASLVPLEATQ